MKKSEMAEILARINGHYPEQFLKLDENTKKVILNSWYERFIDYDFKVVLNAMNQYIDLDTKGFPPKVGQIKEMIRKIQFSDELSEQEAVNLIMKAISNSYNVHTAFKELPKILQRIVGSPKQLYSWGMMELDTVQSVIASNVGRSYRSMMKHHQEQQVINPQLTTEKRKELE